MKRAHDTHDCPFCSAAADRVVAESDLTITIRDGYPVSPGHTLVVTKRHIESLFDMTGEEQAEIMAAVRDAKHALDAEFGPDGFNIGVNVGAAAGQTVMHAHVHVIPRFKGDTADPRGGIRHCIPGKGYYEVKA
jgi:diadenosine tetraphosphate (Ap4A) HIT family hydrolase